MTAPNSPGMSRTGGNRRARRLRSSVHGRISLLTVAALLCNVLALAGQGPILEAPRAVANSAAQFLELATFGPTAADVAAVQTGGKTAWLAYQFSLPETPLADGLSTDGVRNQLFLNMANAPDQLRQRMMFALSQFIVVSANKTGSGEELTPWVRLLSRNAFGNFRTLMRDVTLSPTMGKYLDLAYSRKASSNSSPNENYPRELMQLFTIGLWEMHMDGTLKVDTNGQPIPTYTQNHIRDFARALTGWTFPTMPGATPQNSNPQYFVGNMEPRTSTHDTGSKTLLQGVVIPASQTTTQDMESVLDNIFSHPNVAPFVAIRLIRSLVTSNPSAGYIHRVANAFANNGAGVRGDLRAVLTAVLTDPEAQSFAAEDGRLKDPVLHMIGLGRALGAQIGDPNQYNWVFNNLAQRVLTPTTVFSFYSPLATLPGHSDLYGPEFQIYPPALAIQRANFIYGLLNGQFGSAFAVDLTPYKALAANPTTLVDRVNQTLMFGRMSDELRELILVATSAVPASDTTQRALGALYLAAISSEHSVFADNSGVGATTVQPPTNLVTASVSGNVVTLRWNPPTIGPSPTGYVFEAGVRPGEVLASMPTGSTSPTFSFAAPPGSFYVRMHTLSGANKSRASSEIRVYVDVAAGPTAPSNLLGVVKGSSLGLSWRNTFGGGAPTSLILDVSGDASASISLPLSESFTFPSVPPGSYRFTVRALNAAGSSGTSNPVTLTFPTNCSGSPGAPVNFIASKAGNVISLNWQPAASGAATLSYTINVSGAFNVSVPTAARSISSPVPAGTYNFSIRAVNSCGTSSATPVQSVTIP